MSGDVSGSWAVRPACATRPPERPGPGRPPCARTVRVSWGLWADTWQLRAQTSWQERPPASPRCADISWPRPGPHCLPAPCVPTLGRGSARLRLPQKSGFFPPQLGFQAVAQSDRLEGVSPSFPEPARQILGFFFTVGHWARAAVVWVSLQAQVPFCCQGQNSTLWNSD